MPCPEALRGRRVFCEEQLSLVYQVTWTLGDFPGSLERYLDTLVVQKSQAVQVCLVVPEVLQLQESLSLQGLQDVLEKERIKFG